MRPWSIKDITNQKNKNIFITGATSGIGFEASSKLAKLDANVYILARNKQKALNCIDKIKKEYPLAKIYYLGLDVSSIKSINDFLIEFKKLNIKIDVLILNAGVYNIAKLELTVDGFERQLMTNYLGHFILANSLLEYMNDNSRIITLSSISHTWDTIHFDNLNLIGEYSPIKAYAQSKLAALMFAIKLNNNLKNSNKNIIAASVHPGISNTGLTRCGDTRGKISKFFNKLGFLIAGQSAKKGAWCILFAATSVDLEGGKYYGPKGLKGSRGKILDAKISDFALDDSNLELLWLKTVELLNKKH